MQKINLGQKTLGFIPVPEGTVKVTYESCNLFYHLQESSKGIWFYSKPDIELIGIPKDLTEQQWAGIVGYQILPFTRIKAWYNYQKEEHMEVSATDSGLSLLIAHGFNHQNVLIIEIK